MLHRRVMLVDDHPMVRRGLKRLIEETGKYAVVAEAETGHEAIHMAEVHNPEIILLDIQLPGVTGLKIARVLRKHHSSAKVIFLSMHMDDDRIYEAIRTGAMGFLTKDCDGETLLDTIRRVAQGENTINQVVLSRPHLAWRLLQEFRTGANRPAATDDPATSTLNLSAREIEVLDCVAQGLSNKQIADTLYVTEQTVKNHMTSVLRKLDVEDRVQALLYAVKNGWVEIGPQEYAPVQKAATA